MGYARLTDHSGMAKLCFRNSSNNDVAGASELQPQTSVCAAGCRVGRSLANERPCTADPF